MVKIWEVEFGKNFDRCHVHAETFDEAVKKARDYFAREIRKLPDQYWLSKVELIAQAEI